MNLTNFTTIETIIVGIVALIIGIIATWLIMSYIYRKRKNDKIKSFTNVAEKIQENHERLRQNAEFLRELYDLFQEVNNAKN